MSFELPPEVKQAVRAWLARAPAGGLKAGSARLRKAYAAGQSSSAVDIAAYLTTRMPATFAAVSFVLHEIAGVAAGFTPHSLLDVGAGPGTAALAAMQVWPEVKQVRLVEKDSRFADAAEALLPNAEVERNNLQHFEGKAELVMAAYVLAELPIAEVSSVAKRLWSNCDGVLIVVEPGTPQGFARVKAVRDSLLAEGAHLVGPCTHCATCPVTGNDWCHFKTRLPRSRDHMHAKGAVVPFEDEAFSWIAFARTNYELPAARIVGPPADNKAGLRLRICDAAGLHDETIASRDKATYKRLRKLSWGHGVPLKLRKEDADT